jgi:hypothetical protein
MRRILGKGLREKNLNMNPNEKLCVKSLAFELGVSSRYVYEMRRCGFVMEGRRKDNQTATVKEAVVWIEQNDFKMVDGVGKVQKSAKATP